MSQTALAAALQTSQASVCEWERGKHKPNKYTLARIAKALQVEESELA